MKDIWWVLVLAKDGHSTKPTLFLTAEVCIHFYVLLNQCLDLDKLQQKKVCAILDQDNISVSYYQVNLLGQKTCKTE